MEWWMKEFVLSENVLFFLCAIYNLYEPVTLVLNKDINYDITTLPLGWYYNSFPGSDDQRWKFTIEQSILNILSRSDLLYMGISTVVLHNRIYNFCFNWMSMIQQIINNSFTFMNFHKSHSE